MKKIKDSYKLFGIGKITKSKKIEIESKHVSDKKRLYRVVNDLRDSSLELDSYDDMLDNLDHDTVKKALLKMPKPSICKSNNRLQQIVMNYRDIVDSQTQSNDMVEFRLLFEKILSSTLMTTTSINGMGQLIINDRKSDKNKIENIIIDSIVKIRKCIVCGGYKTFVTKENRMPKITCELCKSSSTIN